MKISIFLPCFGTSANSRGGSPAQPCQVGTDHFLQPLFTRRFGYCPLHNVAYSLSWWIDLLNEIFIIAALIGPNMTSQVVKFIIFRYRKQCVQKKTII